MDSRLYKSSFGNSSHRIETEEKKSRNTTLTLTFSDRIIGMDSDGGKRSKSCHVVAIPFPGRGHVNPMLSFCESLASRRADILITFVVTEEWLGFITGSGDAPPPPPGIRFAAIPNVVPSERVRGADIGGFIEAVSTKMEDPFEQLLQEEELPPVTAILADTFLIWAVGVGNRRNIPVVSLWTMSASVFSMFHHFDLLVQNGHHPVDISGA